MRRPLIVALASAVLLLACQDVKRSTVSEERSPDGAWIARVRLEQHGGPGTAGDIGSVDLVWKTGEATEVLSVEQDDARPDHIQVRWMGPRALQITVRGAQVDFQAVKSGGVSIATTEAP
jgi:hypothetical protein